MIRFLKSLYLHQRVFYALFSISALFLLSYWIRPLYAIAWLAFFAVIVLFLLDCIALYKGRGIDAERILPEKFSNSDENPVILLLRNRFGFTIHTSIIDELPIQFQKRDFEKKVLVSAQDKTITEYAVRPVERGEYRFGLLNIYVNTPLRIVKRRFTFNNAQMVKVYPSYIQMKAYDFLAKDNRLALAGLKKIRRIGHTMEFEQIKDYILGDDVRTINWKATAKRGNLMVNQFQDEKAQPVYSVIDTSRVMKMPFEGLKLLDYAINSALAFSNIALKKNDKVGLVTFSNVFGDFLKANSKKTHLNTISESLYNVDTRFLDSDYSLLYSRVKRNIPQRSLLLLYTNFEHITALQRQLAYLKAINRKHILVVIFFENTELEELVNSDAENINEIYHKTIANQFSLDKRLMQKELMKHGIQSILTKPKDLTVNTINRYLEIKARGIL